MALRVLLADESFTIRKAILMALADYGPDIKAVQSGLDVLSVAQSFEPDLILIDVLLTKKNGYEVALELKSEKSTQNIPIILMWSNFMQLDLGQYMASRANDSIEKPFDSETLRAKIEKQLPNLKTHPLRTALNLPRMPDIIESTEYLEQKAAYDALTEAEKNAIRIGPVEPPVAEVVVPPPPPVVEQAPKKPPRESRTAEELNDATEDEWSPQKASQFVIETENFGDYEEVKSISSQDGEQDLQSQINDQIQSYIKDSPVATHRAQSTLQTKTAHSSFDEQLIREEIRQIAERVCWQVIPEVTEKIVREELAKLLKGIENNT
jgi:CheY-like chemotaxis protein